MITTEKKYIKSPECRELTCKKVKSQSSFFVQPTFINK